MKRIVLLITAAALTGGCSGKSGPHCGNSDASTSEIKGPAVGADGNNADNPFRALAIHPTDPNTLYVGSEGNGLFKSTDGGSNWTWLRAGIYHCNAYPEVYSIAIDSANTQRVYFAANSGPGGIYEAHSSTAGVYKSEDGGSSWTQMATGLPTGDANSVWISPGSHVVVGLGAGTSTNAGAAFYSGGIFFAGLAETSWSQAVAPVVADESIFWQIISRTSGLLTFGGIPTSGSSSTAVGLLKSTDSGRNWTALTDPLANKYGAHVEASQDLQTIYASQRSDASAPYFYKSTNGGASWTNPASVSASGNGPIRIIGSNANTALVGSHAYIYRTTDGFSSVSTVLSAAGGIMAIDTAPSNSNIVYATAKGLLVYRSTDGGASFSQVANLRTFIDSH